LRARNYDPTTGRFLSEDSYLGKATDTLSLNLYTYCENDPVMYIDPSGHKPEKLKDMVTASGGAVTWNNDTKTATVNIQGTEKIYTVGKDGAYIENGRLYIPGEKLAADYNGTYSEMSGSGVSGYSLSINNPGYYSKINSITFDTTAAGERAAGEFNLILAGGASRVEGYLTLLITAVTYGIGGEVIKGLSVTANIKTIFGLDFIKAHKVYGGYTYVSQYEAFYTSSGGCGGSECLIIPPDNQ
jgi:hypothetical protein